MSKNINNQRVKIYLGDAVLYKDKTYYLDEKNGEIGIVNFESGAWGRDFPFIPLSKIDMNKVTDMMGKNIEIVNQKFKEGGGVSDYDKWEGDVAEELSLMLDIPFSDAYGIIQANSFYMTQSWGKDLTAEETAKLIDEKTNIMEKGSVLSDETDEQMPKPIIELFDNAHSFLRKKYPKLEGQEELEDTDLFWDMVEDVRNNFDTETPTIYGEVGEEIVRKYLNNDNKQLEGGGVSSQNAEKIAKLQKVVDSAMIPDAVKEKARLEIEKLRSEEGKDKSEKVEQKGLSVEQREINKKALALITKNKFDSQKVLQGIVHLSLEDANYHTAAFEFAKLVDSNIKTKQDWYRTEIFKITEKQRDVAIEISQMCGWEGEKILATYEFVLKMLGFHNLFDKLNEAMKDDSNEGNYPNAIDNLTSNQMLYASTIAPKVGLTKEIIGDFIKRNGLTEKETLNLMQGVGMGKVSGADFMTAVIGLPNNEFEEKIVAFAKSDEAFKAEPKKEEAPIVKDDRVKGKNISDISTYIPHRAIESIVVTHAGKKVTLKGSDIFDGIYVENKVLGIKDKTKKQPKVARTQFEEETFEFGDGGSVVENKLMKLKEEGKLKTLVNVNGQKYFQTIIPNKQEKGYWKRYYSLNQNSLGKMQNAMLSEDDLKNLFEQQQDKMAKGGYTRPGMDIKTTGDYEFRTNSGLGYEFRVVGFERQGDDTDSLYFDDLEKTAKRELGAITIKNNAWKKLSKGQTITAVSSTGVKGKLTRMRKFELGGTIQEEIDYIDNRIYNLKQLKEVSNEDEQDYFENHIKNLEKEKAELMNKRDKPKEETKKRGWFFKNGGVLDGIKYYDKRHFIDNETGISTISLLDKNGNIIYFKDSNDYFIKREFDKNGKLIYEEDSKQGIIFDNRNKKMSDGGQTPAQKKKIEKVMHEFKMGTLKSSSGDKVTDRDQAIAIALSEAGLSKKMEEGGGLEGQGLGKHYYQTFGIGKSKYVVNYYDGKKKHNDGSPFYDIAIFKNKIELEKFLDKLTKEGYKRTSTSSFYTPKIKSKGGWVLYDEDSQKEIKTFENESDARKALYEYSGNANIVKKENWENTNSKNMKAKGGWSHKK